MHFRDLGAFGERLAIAGDAGMIGLDHYGIGKNYGESVLGLADGNGLRSAILITGRVSELLALAGADSIKYAPSWV